MCSSDLVKFTNEKVQIEIFANVDKDYAAISVKDTGEGIPPELLPHIFEKFRQGDSSSKRRRSGTGLGLALVKTLVELHGGHISVRSELGQGTQFTIYLPLVSDNPAN